MQRLENHTLIGVGPFITRYLVFIAVGLALVSYALPDAWIKGFCWGLAQITGAILGLLSKDVILQGDILRWADHDFAMQVTRECSALEFNAILTAAILAYHHVRWRVRLKGVLFGLVVIQTLNVLRLVSLHVAGYWWPDAFHWIHENLWPILLSVDLVLVFFAWAWYQQGSINPAMPAAATG